MHKGLGERVYPEQALHSKEAPEGRQARREQGSLDHISSCGGRVKQLDSRYILEAELMRGWTKGVNGDGSHEDSQTWG